MPPAPFSGDPASTTYSPVDGVRTQFWAYEAKDRHRAGFDASYNVTFPGKGGWVSPWKFGLNEGPIVLMIENALSGLLWDVFRRSPYVVEGLRRAGFRRASSRPRGTVSRGSPSPRRTP